MVTQTQKAINTYFGKLVQGGVVARDDRDGWGNQRSQHAGRCGGGSGAGAAGWGHAGGLALHRAKKQRPLHTPGVRTVVTKS